MKKIGEEKYSNSLRKQVFNEIEGAILNGELLPGNDLAECKLSAELGVSRTPVREALMQLELEGLVETIPNKGAFVVGVSQKDIEDIYTIRMYIEGLAARWAAQNITEDELLEMKEIIELQEFYAQKDDTFQVWRLDADFHELIYSSCRSRPLKHTLSSFHNYIQKARESSIKTAGRTAASVFEHRGIYNAILNRDKREAERLIILHIKNARDNLHFKQNEEN